MKNLRAQSTVLIKVVYATLAVVVQLVLLPLSVVQAELPIRPQPGLPQRPIVPRQVGSDSRVDPRLVRIILYADGQYELLWTVVQWQGADGVWHDVDGWRGQFNRQGQVRWRVDPKDFGTGPFRWVVYRADAAEITWISDPFKLPSHGETLELKAVF